MKLQFQEETLGLESGESVLECLERHGHAIPNSCRSGICQSCMMKAEAGEVPELAQRGLQTAQLESGYFLSCMCRPTEDLAVRKADDLPCYTGVITSIDALSETVLGVGIRCAELATCRAGQFINLIHPEGAVRSYSVARPPGPAGDLYLHVARMPQGVMSGWLHDVAQPGMSIELMGPMGSCCYASDKGDQPLLLAGTGTGLAPLIGIALDALSQGHQGAIHLFHGSLYEQGLYLREVLQAMAMEHPQFHYHPCVLNGPAPEGVTVGAIDAFVGETLPELKGWRVYLCGPDVLVKQLHRKTFLSGVSLGEIFADSFLPAAQPVPAS